jgi:hypothetical protein
LCFRPVQRVVSAHSRSWLLTAVAVCLAVLLSPAAARAQDIVEVAPEDLARFHFGPLHLTPSLSLSNIGADTNVFNESADEKGDTTAAVGPAANYWVRVGRTRLIGRSFGQYLYFNRYTNQRSWNTGHNLRGELTLTHLKPFLFGNYTNTRDRPGYEIDSRARRRDTTIGAGTDVMVSGRSTLVFTASQSTIAFDQSETFLGAALANTLDRTTTSEQVQLRYALTPLTTLVVTAEALQDRFRFSTLRDGNSIRVTSGFEFKPSALISGKVMIGGRTFDAFNPDMPDFGGLVASVDAAYVIARTLVVARVGRDLAYSYQFINPYYALSDVALSVTERFGTSWDVIGRAGWQSMAYSTLDSSASAADRTDKGRVFGGGVGYLLGDVLRIGFDANYYQRLAPLAIGRDYQGLRMGASISYGSTQ